MKKSNANGYHDIFQRHEKNPLLTADDWPYPVNSVFNAGAVKANGDHLLLVRVEDRRGFSHLCAARSKDGFNNWIIDPEPTLAPSPVTNPEEVWGIEDPRLTWMEDLNLWAVVYTAYSRGGPLVSIATTEDFKKFTRIGPVMPPEDKDAALFPIKFKGRYAMLHRPVSTFSGTGAHIWISFSPDLKHWGDHQVLLQAKKGGWWDADKIGLSPPPLQTDDGWLILYHGVRKTVNGGIYRLGVALLDLEDPTRVLRRSDQWIFGPQESYEREGDVDDVVFPCGWIAQGDEIRLYYGVADSSVALATGKVSDLMEFVRNCPEGPGSEW
ncbi:MAG TPA: glycosidase [Desulfomonilaceae bacterium]|nr:glycosidase [Desulfomonilaceae bacterium]